jgi:hypothetical protein
MFASLTSEHSPIKGQAMNTIEQPEAELKQQLSSVHVHTLSVDDLRLIIETDPHNIVQHILNGPLIVKSSSGSTYDIELLSPTLDKKYYAGTAKVRQAKYTRTQANGRQNEKTEYIGISAGDTPRLQFFSNIADETPNEDDEHSILRVPSSESITGIELVIDWSK